MVFGAFFFLIGALAIARLIVHFFGIIIPIHAAQAVLIGNAWFLHCLQIACFSLPPDHLVSNYQDFRVMFSWHYGLLTVVEEAFINSII